MLPARLRYDGAQDHGFTLIELLVVMAIAGVLASLGIFGFANWQTTAQHQGSAQELVSQLRNTAELALSEGRTHCVDLDAANRSYSVYRRECSAAGTLVSRARTTQSSAVTFTASMTEPTPEPPCPAGHDCVYFYPRGTATQGTITVASSKRSKLYTIHIEGLTARVYM